MFPCSLRKALVQLHLNQVEPAGETLRHLLRVNPGHLGGSILMTRLALDTEGPPAGAAQFQQALSASRPEDRPGLASLASFLGSSLARSGYPAAAIKHLELAARLSSDEAEAGRPRISTICEPIPPSRCGRRIPIVFRRRRIGRRNLPRII